MSKPSDDANIYQPVPIEEFLSRPQVLVDTYIKLAQNKFILIAKGGQNTPADSLEKYKSRNLDCLYIRVEDYQRLLLATIQGAVAVAGDKRMPINTRATVVQDAMKAVYQEIADLGFNDQVYSHARLVNHATLTMLKDQTMGDMLEKFGMFSREGMAHSMMVSMVSVMLGMKHEWVKPATLEKLGMGGFLHDVGKSKLPPQIASMQYERMNRDEKVIYHSHCEVGFQLLAQTKSVPEDVLLIVAQHHERADGTGFPKGIKDFAISPLARVVSLANAFVERIADEGKPLSGDAAFRVFEEFRVHRGPHFNKEALRALGKCLDLKTQQAAG
ncbi:MAG: HD domain-containing phosphohydrolase [Bdellovibrionota bacterium]